MRDGATGATIEGYSYDATGNRASFTNSAGTQHYVYPTTSHRLSEVDGQTRTYDEVGNTKSIGGLEREFSYNSAGRMSGTRRHNSLVAEYEYNGRGEQVRKVTGPVSVYRLHDEGGRWFGEFSDDGSPIQMIVWLDELPVGVISGNQLRFIEADHLGSPRAIIDPDRDVAVWTWDLASEAFGNSSTNQDPDLDGIPLVFDMRYPGQLFDSSSGLNFNYFRDYDPSTGRYVQSDPIGLMGGITTYGYVGSDPLTAIDFYGLARCRLVERRLPDSERMRELPLIERSRSDRNCVPWPELVTPGPQDLIPDPVKLSRRQFPMSIGLGVALWCQKVWLRTLQIEVGRYRSYATYEVCIDDCGKETSTFVGILDQVPVWRRVGERTEIIKTGWVYYPPGVAPE
jgi:RHS repeat-associated protein